MAKINNLVVVSDLHCGCRVGLCPPDPIPLDDGGTYTASRFQAKVWAWWEEFWGEWVPMATRGEPFDVLVNGDSIDGVHHGSTTQVSHNIGDQLAIAVRCLQIPRAKCHRMYFTRGTEAHVGQSGVDEESLARQMGAVKDAEGRYARYELRYECGKALVHASHHIGTTGRAHYETSAPKAEIGEMWMDAAKNGDRPVDFVVRSHRHRLCEVPVATNRGRGGAYITPGWQGKTPFAYRVPGGRVTAPEFGGILIRQGDEEFFGRVCRYTLDPVRIEK